MPRLDLRIDRGVNAGKPEAAVAKTFVTVDNGFALATVKQEGKKYQPCVIKAAVSCPLYFPPLRNYLLLRPMKASGKAWLSLWPVSYEL